jgi:cysteine-rich repeat protein
MTRIAALFGAAALVGCASIDDPSTSTDPDLRSPGVMPETPTAQNAAFDIFATYSDGLLAPADTFAAKPETYLDARVHGHVVASRSVAGPGADYYFQVLDGNGVLVSTDDIACRKIHIDGHGQIDKVYAATELGKSCEHPTALDDAGGLTVRLVPYADSSLVIDDGGVKKQVFELMLVATHHDDGVIYAKRAPVYRFYVAEPPPSDPVCGNGVREGSEQCDDGNRLDCDGCSSTCTAE